MFEHEQHQATEPSEIQDASHLDRGSNVVCLHGLRRSPSDWDGVRAGLARHGTVRTPGLPPRLAEALAAADAGIAANDIVVGHSMGGVLALRLAQTRPRPLRALILTGCFFAPARNGRTVATTIADYAGHRLAFARDAIRDQGDGRPPGGSARDAVTPWLVISAGESARRRAP